MPPEGMVHALEIIHNLLQPQGTLVDIHPSGESPTIELVHGGHKSLLGYLQETDDFVEYSQASAALAQAVDIGLFQVERQGTFQFSTVATSVDELRAYLTDNWQDAILSPEIDQRASMLSGVTLPGEVEDEHRIVLTEQVNITRYQLM
jgi:hypothetical protein